jgi:GNAT superfamily N-acetyltransferase
MLTIQQIDAESRAEVRRFVDLPFRLYANRPQWVPPLKRDVRLMLNRRKHPFYERSEADSFLALRDGREVGRLAVLENRPFNAHHGTSQASFYCFECEDDQEAAKALFERAFEWARRRGLTRIIGPKGFSAFDGYGLLIEGFEHRPLMTMTNYNLEYYPRLLEGVGFVKEVDFVTFLLDRFTFRMSDRVRRIADRIRARGPLRVSAFPSKRALKRAAPSIGRAYNDAFVNNWEFYPLSDREIDLVVEQLVLIANPRFIKVIYDGDRIVGFLLAFPDLSAALQRARGRLTPWGLVDLLLEMRRTTWVALNGAGILPEYQGRGGNALLYTEIERTILDSRFEYAELPQVAETAVQMRRDLAELGARPRKTHRVYTREI